MANSICVQLGFAGEAGWCLHRCANQKAAGGQLCGRESSALKMASGLPTSLWCGDQWLVMGPRVFVKCWTVGSTLLASMRNNHLVCIHTHANGSVTGLEGEGCSKRRRVAVSITLMAHRVVNATTSCCTSTDCQVCSTRAPGYLPCRCAAPGYTPCRFPAILTCIHACLCMLSCPG